MLLFKFWKNRLQNRHILKDNLTSLRVLKQFSKHRERVISMELELANEENHSEDNAELKAFQLNELLSKFR